MTDVNEQSFAAGANADRASVGVHRSRLARITSPLWRIRPAAPPVNLVRRIRTEIIPKIVVALRTIPSPKPIEAFQDDTLNSRAFAALVIGESEEAVTRFVDNLVAQGVKTEAIILDLLTPAARHLGGMWETDATDFASVTLGISRIQRILHMLSDSFFNEYQRETGGETALLTAIPGEQHSLGLSIVSEFFRRSGWNLCTGPFESYRELISIVQSRWFDVIGFSVSGNRRIEELRLAIQDIRRDSRNRNVGIMLGGPMMIERPELVASLGADIISGDAARAPQQARILVAEIVNRENASSSCSRS